MSRDKKSRSAGNSGPKFDGSRKETSSQAQESRDKKRKDKLKGNKAGNRNAVESKQGAQQNQRQAKNDKRIGSKKPIALTPNQPAQTIAKPKVVMQPKAKMVKAQVVPTISPEKEIANIENNERLNDLLEQAENDSPLSQIDQAWVDKQMQRHEELMKKLGWIDEEGEEDLLQQFEDASSALDEFR